MAKDPAFLFYSSDFLTGVADLTMEERGQYITLLCLQHQKGPLSEKMIRTICKKVSKDVLAKFERNEAGFYYNSRLEKEAQRRMEYTESRRQNRLGKGKHMLNISKTYVPHMENEDVSILSNSSLENSNSLLKDSTANEKKAAKKFQPPELREVQEYFMSTATFWTPDKSADQALRFYNHYESNGWRVGKNQMKKWTAAASGWISRCKQFENHGNNTNSSSQRVGRMAKSDLEDFMRMPIPDIKIGG